jgi:hypothetical protein
MKTKLEPHQYTTTPPEGCPFKPGDVVTYTNEFGIIFKGQKIYGFALEKDWLHGTDYILTEGGAYWFPNNIGSFVLEDPPSSGCPNCNPQNPQVDDPFYCRTTPDCRKITDWQE